MLNFYSPPPLVRLTKAFTTPLNNAIATARTCYSSRIIQDEDVDKDDKSRALRDRIAQSTYQAGHHTTLQHAHFQFTIENISRQALWSFFHAHPFYNSEQVSQRYVAVHPERFVIPKFQGEASQKCYQMAILRQMNCYAQLIEALKTPCDETYFTIYPGRKKNQNDKRWQSAIHKRAMEIARYVLPIGTHSHLYHTISGLTLHRYHRLSQIFDCPAEQRLVIDQMVQAVHEFDPLFFANKEDSIALEDTLEAQVFQQFDVAINNETQFKEFDNALEGRVSKLLTYPANASSLIGIAVRQMLGAQKESLDDDVALELLLNPANNSYLGNALNLSTLSKLNRALDLVHFTFQKKISHAADSQAQRHRMLSGTRPILWRQFSSQKCDYITPMLFEHRLAGQAADIYHAEMQKIHEDICFLIERKESPESWQYLLPNAFPVRYFESGSLLHYHPKWKGRLCYNAQEEIWQHSLEEVRQISQVLPSIGKWLQPPCTLRLHAKQSPICPEGNRFCGVPVWKVKDHNFVRIL